MRKYFPAVRDCLGRMIDFVNIVEAQLVTRI